MKHNSVAFLWQDSGAVRHFRAAVCLHCHTTFYDECLDFLPRYLRYVPANCASRHRHERRGAVKLARAYWTPPLRIAPALSELGGIHAYTSAHDCHPLACSGGWQVVDSQMQKGPFGAEAEVRDLILFEAKPLAGEADRHKAVERLLRECVYFLHAFELNGTRSWHEDAASIELGRASARPVISGGDRHACEPAGCLNLTDVRLF